MLKNLIFTLALVPNISIADVTTSCPITPEVWSDNIGVIDFIKSNNLRKKTGSSEFANGEFVDVTGVILDSNCAPISEAVVEIWQADADGNYGDAKNFDKNFSYTGTAITDNEGNFSFLTVFPGRYKNHAPRIHFKIRHVDFLPLETIMYFPNNSLNEFDINQKKILDKNKQLLLMSKYIESVDKTTLYNFNITLNGVNKYKRF